MGIPEEDLGPRWLRDYGTLYDIGGKSDAPDSGTGLRVDMPAMKDFAAALRTNVDDDYRPHAQKVFDDMTTNPVAQEDFFELWYALNQHVEVKQAATDNVANQGNGAKIFAHAADEISTQYRSTDAYASANISDVKRYLGTTPPPTGSTVPGTDPTVDPAGGV